MRSLNLFDIIILIPGETFGMCPVSQLAYKYVSCIIRVYHSPQLFTKKDWVCSIKPLDIIILIPRETLGMYCFHIVQLMTHTAVQTLSFTLQLCYKPLGIPQRVTKNQKVYISIHNRLRNTNIMNHSWASNSPCRILKKALWRIIYLTRGPMSIVLNDVNLQVHNYLRKKIECVQ